MTEDMSNVHGNVTIKDTNETKNEASTSVCLILATTSIIKLIIK